MLTLLILYIIFYTALLSRKDISVLLARIAIITYTLIIYLNIKTFDLFTLSNSISLFNGVFQFNSNTHFFDAFILILATIIITLNGFYPRNFKWAENKTEVSGITNVINYSHDKNILKINKREFSTIPLTNKSEKESNIATLLNSFNEKANKNLIQINNEVLLGNNSGEFKIKEYTLIISFILVGAIFLMSANDIVSIFLSIELQSYGLYLLSTIYRNSELSTKAGLVYFLLGGLSSCIILLGQGILYINSGNTNMDNLYILSDITSPILQIVGSGDIYSIVKHIPMLYDYYYINLSLIIMSAGFMFKVSAAPFHFWSPDVYDSIPTTITTFVAIIAKISIFVLFLDIVHFTSNIYLKSDWTNNLLISCLLSLIIGSVLGLTQFRIKRLYAYSTINHVGFILLALCINTLESVQAFIFYIVQYSITNLNAFIILIAIGYFILTYYNDNKEYKDLKEKNNSPIQLIAQLKGFYKVNNMLSLSLAITLLSFLGVPPLLGFFGKQMVLSVALNNGYIFITLIAVLASVISAVYYLVVIKHIFFDESEYTNIIDNKEVTKRLENIKLSSHLSISISILTLLITIYMFTGRVWLDVLTIMSLFIFNL